MTNERIAEIRARLAKLPKEPWSRETHDVVRGDNRYGSDPYNVLVDDNGKVIADSMNSDIRCIEGNCDDGFFDSGTLDAFELFVHAPDDLRDLLDALTSAPPVPQPTTEFRCDERGCEWHGAEPNRDPDGVTHCPVCGSVAIIEPPSASQEEPTQATSAPCRWHEDAESGSWDTDCGHRFEFIDDGPAENGQRFCGYCGRVLEPVKGGKR